MNPPLPPPFYQRLADRKRELEAVRDYPVERLAAIIREVGFSCDLCGRCCTRAFNGHVLLLEEDVARIRAIEPTSLEPPPEYDFCDQHGNFYVSGYTLRARPGIDGECHFLLEGRCRIYSGRPWICRIYPYMLHREPDEEGLVDWRQVGGLDQHGEYHSPIPADAAGEIASDVKAFECAVIQEEIAFIEYTGRHFFTQGLRHVRKRFDDGMRALRSGSPIIVKVYYRGSYESWVVQDGRCSRADEKEEGI